MMRKLQIKPALFSANLHDPTLEFDGVYNERAGISVTTSTKGL